MDPFLAAQSDAPFDPAPMLIRADWLEEQGDATGAAVLRVLVASGTPSLHALALEAALRSGPWKPDLFENLSWYGFGCGPGSGDAFAFGAGYGSGFGDGDKLGIEDAVGGGGGGGPGTGSGDGYRGANGHGSGHTSDLDG